MQPALGVLKKAPEDGVLRGRVGLKRWLWQLGIVVGLGFIVFLVTLIAFAGLHLILLLVFATIGCFALALFWTWFYPLAWMGLDLTMPTVFDLNSEDLEVGSWRQYVFERRIIPRKEIKDLRVYRAAVDFSAAAEKGVCYDEPRPLLDSQVNTFSIELPKRSDALRECGRALTMCCSNARPPPGVATAFLAAKVENEDGDEEIIPLTRAAWSLDNVKELCDLAREARERAELPDLPPVPQEEPVGASLEQLTAEAQSMQDPTSPSMSKRSHTDDSFKDLSAMRSGELRTGDNFDASARELRQLRVGGGAAASSSGPSSGEPPWTKV